MQKKIGDISTMLDLGCGDGEFTKSIAEGKKWNITGVELYQESIKQAKLKGVYKSIVKSDLTKLPATLKKFDVVLASQVIEHLPKKKGELFLNQIEKLARKRVIVSTPVGFIPFHQIEKGAQDKNPLQKHLSGWEVDEMRKRGYEVYGQGIGDLYHSEFVKSLPGVLFPLVSACSFLFSPLIYFMPQKAMYMIAVKDLTK